MSDTSAIRDALGGYVEKKNQGDNASLRSALNDLKYTVRQSVYNTPYPNTPAPSAPKPTTPPTQPTTTPTQTAGAVQPPASVSGAPQVTYAPNVTPPQAEPQDFFQSLESKTDAGIDTVAGLLGTDTSNPFARVGGFLLGAGQQVLGAAGDIAGTVGQGINAADEAAIRAQQAIRGEGYDAPLPSNYIKPTDAFANLAGAYNEGLQQPIAGIGGKVMGALGETLFPAYKNKDADTARLTAPTPDVQQTINDTFAAIGRGDIAGALGNVLASLQQYGNQQYEEIEKVDPLGALAASLVLDPLNFVPGMGVGKAQQAGKLAEITRDVGRIENVAELLPKGVMGRIMTPAAKVTETVKSALQNIGLRTQYADNAEELFGNYRRFMKAGEDAKGFAKVVEEMAGMASVPAQRAQRLVQGMGKEVDTIEQAYRTMETALRGADELTDVSKLPKTFQNFIKDVRAGTASADDALDVLKAEMATRTSKYFAEQGAKLFPVKGMAAPVKVAERFMNELRGFESLVYIGLSPFTFVRNVINGVSTMAIEGLNPLWDAGREIERLTKMGQVGRAKELERAIKFQETLMNTSGEVRKAMGLGTYGTGATGYFGNFMSNMIHGTPIGKPLQWYQRTENAMRARVWSQTYYRALQHNWDVGKFIPEMDAVTQAVLHQYRVDPQKIMGIVREAGVNDKKAVATEVLKYLRGERGGALDIERLASEMGLSKQQLLAFLDEHDLAKAQNMAQEIAGQVANGKHPAQAVNDVVGQAARDTAEEVAARTGAELPEAQAGMTLQELEARRGELVAQWAAASKSKGGRKIADDLAAEIDAVEREMERLGYGNAPEAVQAAQAAPNVAPEAAQAAEQAAPTGSVTISELISKLDEMPPPKEGTIRIYRGVRGGVPRTPPGRVEFYADTLEGALYHAGKGGEVYYVDIPKGVLGKYENLGSSMGTLSRGYVSSYEVPTDVIEKFYPQQYPNELLAGARSRADEIKKLRNAEMAGVSKSNADAISNNINKFIRITGRKPTAAEEADLALETADYVAKGISHQNRRILTDTLGYSYEDLNVLSAEQVREILKNSTRAPIQEAGTIVLPDAMRGTAYADEWAQMTDAQREFVIGLERAKQTPMQVEPMEVLPQVADTYQAAGDVPTLMPDVTTGIPAPKEPPLTLGDVAKAAQGKGIATATAEGKPLNKHLLNVLNKHAAENGVERFASMADVQARAEDALKILDSYAPSNAPASVQKAVDEMKRLVIPPQTTSGAVDNSLGMLRVPPKDVAPPASDMAKLPETPPAPAPTSAPVSDVGNVADVTPPAVPSAPTRGKKATAKNVIAEVTPEQKAAVVASIPEQGTKHVDDIVRDTGLPVSSVTQTLAEEELKGNVTQIGGMNYRRNAPTPAPAAVGGTGASAPKDLSDIEKKVQAEYAKGKFGKSGGFTPTQEEYIVDRLKKMATDAENEVGNVTAKQAIEVPGDGTINVAPIQAQSLIDSLGKRIPKAGVSTFKGVKKTFAEEAQQAINLYGSPDAAYEKIAGQIRAIEENLPNMKPETRKAAEKQIGQARSLLSDLRTRTSEQLAGDISKEIDNVLPAIPEPIPEPKRVLDVSLTKELDRESGQYNYRVAIPEDVLNKLFPTHVMPRAENGYPILMSGYQKNTDNAVKQLYRQVDKQVSSWSAGRATMAETEARQLELNKYADEIKQYIDQAFGNAPLTDAARLADDIPAGEILTPEETARRANAIYEEINAQREIARLRQVATEDPQAVSILSRDEMLKAKARTQADMYEALMRMHQSEPAARVRVGTDAENRVMAWLRRDVFNGMDESRAAAQVTADWMDNAVMISRDGETHFDSALNWLSPFQFWGTRYALQSMRRVADKPARLMWYLKLRDMQDQVENDPRFPKRLRGMMTLPFPGAPKWAGSMWFDPLETFTQIESVFKMNQFDNALTDSDVAGAIRALVESGRVSPSEAANAIANKSGALWDATKAQMEEATKRQEGLDSITTAFKPHMPFDIIWKLRTGNAADIGVLFPMTRLIRNTTSLAPQGSFLNPTGTGINIEQPIKAGLRALTGNQSIPDWDQWEQYRVDRALADMVGDGTISERDALIAMIERKGGWYDEAQRRAQEQMRTQNFTSVFGGQMFPQGEQEYYKARVLKDQLINQAVAQLGGNPNDLSYGEKMELIRANGLNKKGTPLGDFYDQNPVYNARGDAYAEPEERLKGFLTDEVWQKYLALSALDKRMARQGNKDLAAFITNPERDYKAVTLEKAAEWVKYLRGYLPEAEQTPKVGALNQIQFAPPDLSAAYQTMQDEQKALFNLDAMQPRMDARAKMTPNEKRAFDAANPDVAAYYKWYGQKMKENPALAKLIHPDTQNNYAANYNQQATNNYLTDQVVKNLNRMVGKLDDSRARRFNPNSRSNKPRPLSRSAVMALQQKRMNPNYYLPREVYRELIAAFKASGLRMAFEQWLQMMAAQGGV